MTLLIEEPAGGVLGIGTFAVYIISSMVIIQAWLYMTMYVNRYCRWRWYEYVLIAANMFAAILMSNTISLEWISASVAFILSMIVMIGCIGALYAIQLCNETENEKSARGTLLAVMIILVIYAVAMLVSIAGHQERSLQIIISAILLGALLPFVKPGGSPMVNSMPHLMERMELLTIITFGEGIVEIARFFDVHNFSLLPILTFLLLIFMFGSYLIQIHYLCDHHLNKTVRIIWSHYLIILSVNLVTVCLIYLSGDSMDRHFTMVLMMASIVVFYIGLHATSFYYHSDFTSHWWDVLISMAIITAGIAFMYLVPGDEHVLLTGTLITTGGNFWWFWHKYYSQRGTRLEKLIGQ